MNNTGQGNSYSKAWQFIEEYLPNYYHRDDVLRNDILLRYLEGEDVCANDMKWIEDEFQGDKQRIAEELIKLDTKFACEALRAYYEKYLT